MDPTMTTHVAAQEVAERIDRLERERELYRHYGHRRVPGLGRRLRRSGRGSAPVGSACDARTERVANETC